MLDGLQQGAGAAGDDQGRLLHLQLRLDGTVLAQRTGMTAGDLVDIVERTDDLVHRGKDDHLVGVTAGDDGIGQRIGIRQGLGLTVLTGVLVVVGIRCAAAHFEWNLPRAKTVWKSDE